MTTQTPSSPGGPSGSSKPTNDVMALLGGGPSKKSKFSASKPRQAVPLTREPNSSGQMPGISRNGASATKTAKASTNAPPAQTAERPATPLQPLDADKTVQQAPALESDTLGTGASQEASVQAPATSVDGASVAVESTRVETSLSEATASTPQIIERTEKWQDALRSEAKEMTRAANFVSSMLQQNKPLEEMLSAATKLNEQSRTFVAGITEGADTPAMVAERLSPLQKAAGALMRAADKAESPDQALEHAQSRPQTAGNLYLVGALQRAVERAQAFSAEPTPLTSPAPVAAPQDHESTARDTTRERALGASQQQPEATAARSSANDDAEANAEKLGRHVAYPTLQVKTTAQESDETGDLEDSRQAYSNADTDEDKSPRRTTSAATGGEVPASDTAVGHVLDRQEAAVQESVTFGRNVTDEAVVSREKDASGLAPKRKAREAVPVNEAVTPVVALVSERKSIESFLQPPPSRTKSRVDTPALEAATRVHAGAGQGPRQQPDSPGTPATPITETSGHTQGEAQEEQPRQVVAPAERQPLDSALREHMAERGFDNEAQRLAPMVASAVESNGRYRQQEQSLVVLHKDGDRVATATTERSLPVVARPDDSVFDAKTLEHLSEHGLNPDTIRDVRQIAPQATRTMTSLEVANTLGPKFLERANEEGVPKQFMTELREASVEAQRQLSEQTDKSLAQRFSLEHAASQWGAEHRSAEEALRSAPAAAVQMLERVADENRATAVASAPVETVDTGGFNRDSGYTPAQETGPTKTFKLGF